MSSASGCPRNPGGRKSELAELTPRQVEMLKRRNFAHFVTLMADGSPHATPMWVDAADGFVLVNTSVGRVKERNARRDPRVALTVQDRSNGYLWVGIHGTVVEFATEGADEHIDALSRRYGGKRWVPVPAQRRVILRIRPDHVTGQG